MLMRYPPFSLRMRLDCQQLMWDTWLAGHKDSVLNTIALGKTKSVKASGIEDTKNGFMLSSYVQAESLEAAAEIFKDHPHLKLPEATIEIMETRELK